MIDIEATNKLVHDTWCKRLGVDNFKIDTKAQMIRKPDKVVNDYTSFFGKNTFKEKSFSCPIIHWWVNGKKFSAAIPLTLKEVKFNDFLMSGKDTEYDWDEMQKEALKIIKKSKNLKGDEIWVGEGEQKYLIL